MKTAEIFDKTKNSGIYPVQVLLYFQKPSASLKKPFLEIMGS